MRQSKFNDPQILAILKQNEQGVSVIWRLKITVFIRYRCAVDQSLLNRPASSLRWRLDEHISL